MNHDSRPLGIPPRYRLFGTRSSGRMPSPIERATGEAASPAAVKKWREQFKKGRFKDHIAQKLFDNRAAVIETARGILKKMGEEPTADAISEIGGGPCFADSGGGGGAQPPGSSRKKTISLFAGL